MTTFKELGLNSQIQKSLSELGFENPTPIQEKAIPFLLESDKDLIALAQTGTGKTAAFALPIIHKLEKNKKLQAIILCPTRELCLQISKDITKYTKNSPEVALATVYGGERIDRQIMQVRGGANIVVGTPGRVHDMIRRKVLKLADIRWLVLDEADEMLDMGFKDDLDAVLAETPDTKHTLLFSATMSKVVRSIANKYMDTPTEISVVNKNESTENVTHEYYIVKAEDKYEALRRILDSLPDVYGILFCRTRKDTQEVADWLKQDGYSSEPLHGEISQNIRTQIMDKFRKRKVQMLVATDVAARGIDVSDLTHVINYNLPESADTYVHRSGRTGRASKKGISMSIINTRESSKIREIERRTGKTFELKKVPSRDDICQKRMDSFIERIKNTEIDEKQIESLLPVAVKEFHKIVREELIGKFLTLEFASFFEKYSNMTDLNIEPRKFDRERSGGNFTSLRINIGKNSGFDLKALFGLINSRNDLKGIELGRIKSDYDSTIFDIDAAHADKVMKSLQKAKHQGRPVEVRISDVSPEASRPRFGGKRSYSGGGAGGRKKFDRGEKKFSSYKKKW